MAHLLKITVAFEFAVLTLTVPAFRLNEFNDAWPRIFILIRNASFFK
jgi:hypothetical protein